VHLNIALPEEHVTPEVLDAALEVTTRLNDRLVREKTAPPFGAALDAGKVKWKPEPPGAEHFDHAGIVMKRGWGDCDDLAPWMAGSLRASGEDTGAQAIVYQSAPKRWHAIVQKSDGTLLDPSKMAGMGNGKPKGQLPAVVGRMFDTTGHAVVGEDGELLARPAVALKMSPDGRGWVGRTDLPWDDTDYALTALHYAPTAAQAICGSIMGAVLAGETADIARPEHTRSLMAICGTICGDNRDRLCALCGEDAVLGAEDFMSLIAHTLVRPKVSAENAARLTGKTRLDPNVVANAARATLAHPASSPDEKKLAELLHKHAQGERPEPGGLIHAVMMWQANAFGPVVPGTGAEHARLLIADQVAKRLVRDVPELRAMVTGHDVGWDFGSFVSDIGKGIGDAAKAVGGVVRDVAPIVATVANVIPPPIGQVVSGAAALAGAVAGKLVPKSSPQPSPAAAAATYAPAGAAVPTAARPVTYTAPVPTGYRASQPTAPVPPVHVHMAAAPRGAAASAPVNVQAQPGGPVVIRF
jgi:hypothetical protein